MYTGGVIRYCRVYDADSQQKAKEKMAEKLNENKEDIIINEDMEELVDIEMRKVKGDA